MAACGAAGVVAAGYALTRHRTRTGSTPIDRTGRDSWRMLPLDELPRPVISSGRKIGMGALRLYLAVAMILVVVKIGQNRAGELIAESNPYRPDTATWSGSPRSPRRSSSRPDTRRTSGARATLVAARCALDAGQSVDQAAAAFDVSRVTLYRTVAELEPR